MAEMVPDSLPAGRSLGERRLSTFFNDYPMIALCTTSQKRVHGMRRSL